jgi:predicted nucleic acid-binding protein
MNDKFFLDTNIIICEFSTDLIKKEKSKRLIKDGHLKNGIISFQVIQEFLNSMSTKFKVQLNPQDLKEYTENVLFPICEIFPSTSLYFKSLDIKERWQLSFYDSLIVAAALEGNCKILYSEDLQHNQKIFELTIINPYL